MPVLPQSATCVKMNNNPPAPERVARVPRQLHEPLQLTRDERELFDYLLRVKRHAGDGCDLELRVCGGWVRDKLLGRESSDVDVVLDTMSAQDFAALVNAYERACGQKERGVGVMRATAEQANGRRSLEVVTMQIGSMGKVDFASMTSSLASEADASSLKVHEVRSGLISDATGETVQQAFGTPLQDAERRDFTINSLFYNLSTQAVEDFTTQGIHDLRDGVLRMPLDARMMLLDDPIRAVRAVRFASQFDFAFEASLRSALELEEVKHALATKISRRRLGQVLTETLVGAAARPGRAVQLIRDLGLLRPMLLPHVPELSLIVQQDGELVCVLAPVGAAAEGADNESSRHARKLRVLGALLLPFAGLRVPKRDVSLPTYMLRDSLKLSHQDAKDVDLGVLRSLEAVRELVHAGEFDRVRVGLVLRAIKPHWAACRDVALAQELVDNGARSPGCDAALRRRYDAFTASVVTSGLDDIARQPPLFSASLRAARLRQGWLGWHLGAGGELVAALGVRPGAAVKALLDEVLVWQLANPDAGRSACLAHFRAHVSPGAS
ncbi:hypothetical protein PybrP1_006787 [[Pythium] brassicae (nom. inval.)]|nr:hypothetical protein PybrP1_006787 [[Pythium] brassicae (nom. inval.)]